MAKIVILGTIQDGGIPHLNCICKNCLDIQNTKTKKYVSCIGILGKTNSLIIDATPDLPKQINLMNRHLERENLELNGLLLTHLHIGHYTGLIYFGRESASTKLFPIYATKENLSFLKSNKPFSYLFERQELEERVIKQDEEFKFDDSLSIIPFYVPHRNEDGNTVGLEIRNKITNKKVIYITDTDYLTNEIIQRITMADIVILDGTFYKQTEIMRQKLVPHPPILETMKLLGNQHKEKFYFTHINHSNPVLDKSCEEFIEVQKRGYNICEEDMIIEF